MVVVFSDFWWSIIIIQTGNRLCGVDMQNIEYMLLGLFSMLRQYWMYMHFICLTNTIYSTHWTFTRFNLGQYILFGWEKHTVGRCFQKPRSRSGCHTTSLMMGIGKVRSHWSSYLTSLSLKLLKLRKARRERKMLHRWLPRTSEGTSIFPRSRMQRCCSWRGAAGFLTYMDEKFSLLKL